MDDTTLITVIRCNEDGEASITVYEKSAFLECLNRGDYGEAPNFMPSIAIPEDLGSFCGLIVFDGVPITPRPVTTAIKYELE